MFKLALTSWPSLLYIQFVKFASTLVELNLFIVTETCDMMFYAYAIKHAKTEHLRSKVLKIHDHIIIASTILLYMVLSNN